MEANIEDVKIENELEWVAVYHDGTHLFQYAEDGTQTPYTDIDRSRLTEFHLRERETDNSVFAVAFDSPEQRLIYRRRVAMDANSGQKKWVIHLVGWQRTVKGENIQSINWIFPDGSVINTGRFQEDHPMFYGVQFFDEELESGSRSRSKA